MALAHLLCWFLLSPLPFKVYSAWDSVLCPLLLSIYAHFLGNLIRFHGSKYHLQAHNLQNDICSPGTPASHISLPTWYFDLDVSQPSQTEHMQSWFLIWPPRPASLTAFLFSFSDDSIFPVPQTKNLDSSFTLLLLISCIQSTCQEVLLFPPSNLHRIWPPFTNSSSTAWSESTTTSCLDYGSGPLCQFGPSEKQTLWDQIARDFLGKCLWGIIWREWVEGQREPQTVTQGWHLGKEIRKEAG